MNSIDQNFMNHEALVPEAWWKGVRRYRVKMTGKSTEAVAQGIDAPPKTHTRYCREKAVLCDPKSGAAGHQRCYGRSHLL